MSHGRYDRRSAPTRAEAFYFSESDWAERRVTARNWDTTELDAGLYERQMAGIAALISLANELSRPSEILSQTKRGELRQGRLRALSRRLREDPMTWNSLFLVLNTGLQAAFGFTFWIVTARLFSVGDVGKASALISATNLIGSIALFGLNTGVGRYLPDSRNPHALISSGLSLVAASGAVGALVYILLTPFMAPGLSFVEKSPVLVIGFALMTSANALNTLTDSIFVASRKAKYSAFTDSIVGGFGKVILAFMLAGFGAYGAYIASTTGVLLATVASLIIIFTVMHSRLDLKNPIQTLKPLLKFSGVNYIGNVFNMIPGLAVPIILLDRTGPKSAAYFFVVFQVAQIVYAAALALEQTFLAEGSRANADVRGLKRRSLRILVMLCIPAALIIIGGGRWLLLAFGRPYYQNGYISLVVLALAAGPIAANYWFLTVLRLAGKLRAIVVVNATYAVGTCLLAWIGASHGLSGVAVAWFCGALIATCIAAVASREGHLRRRQPGPRDGHSVNRRPNGDPRPGGGAYAPGQSTAGRPRRMPPAVNGNQPGYDRRQPGPRDGHSVDPRPNGDPRPGGGAYAPGQSTAGRPRRMPPAVNGNRPGYDCDRLSRKNSLWD